MTTIADINTRFALPIVCPITGERVSAETLYNRCCAALGHVVDSHIGDLIFDNLDYDAAGADAACGTDASNEALHDAVYAWAKSVREQIARPAAEQIHHFQDGEWTITVKTEKQPNGEFTAIDADNHDLGSPVGWGFSEFSAIADLFEQLSRHESERQDRQAAAWDHARDHRKHA